MKLLPGSAPKQHEKYIRLFAEGILSYSPEQLSNIASALSLLSIDVDSKSNIVEISPETTDPFVSAIVVQLLTRYLIDYVDPQRYVQPGVRVPKLKRMK